MPSNKKIAIVGATGYTGMELTRLVALYPGVDIALLGSEQYAGKAISDIYPNLRGICDIQCEKAELSKLKKMDLVFFATPNGIAHKQTPALAKAGIHVIDLSADYRFRKLATYESWYGFERKSKDDIAINKKAIYGLIEYKRDAILEAASKAQKTRQGVVIGNPGCYTTASILALSPLLEQSHLIDTKSIIIDAKSGISGAGRKAVVETLYAELNESISPYNLANQHRHTPELEAFFSELSGSKIELSFSPHLIPMTRGLLATCYVNLKKPLTENQIRKIYTERYKDEEFVEILDKGLYPKTSWVSNSNRAIIQLSLDKRLNRVIITCAIDNLIKGAAGQALQNMELLFS